MMVLEIAFILLEVLVYGLWFMAIFEIARLWLAYYSYMTLNKCALYGFMFFLFVAAVSNVLSFFSISLTIIGIIAFPLQLLATAYCGYLMWFMLQAYGTAQGQVAAGTYVDKRKEPKKGEKGY